jgi:hypothetical protein
LHVVVVIDQNLREAGLEELTVQVDLFEEAMSDDYESMLDRFGAEMLLKVILGPPRQWPTESITNCACVLCACVYVRVARNNRNWTSTRWSWAWARTT